VILQQLDAKLQNALQNPGGGKFVVVRFGEMATGISCFIVFDALFVLWLTNLVGWSFLYETVAQYPHEIV
jgi:hypothetical protein